uniref:Spindle assembly checkpoint component MAD1 n=1 Tax=Arcella intermedia TaxID=1963864 RepID=A0A6B2KZV1_9EUKA
MNQKLHITQSERDATLQRYNYQEAEAKEMKQRVFNLEQELNNYKLQLEQKDIIFESNLKKFKVENELSCQETTRNLQNIIDQLKAEAVEKERLFKVEREALISQSNEFSNRVRDKYTEIQEELNTAKFQLSAYKEVDTKLALYQNEILALSKENEVLLNEMRQAKRPKIMHQVNEDMQKELIIIKQQNTELKSQIKQIQFLNDLVPSLKRELADFEEKEKYFKAVEKEFLIFKERDQNVMIQQEKINQLEKQLKAVQYENTKFQEMENNYNELLKQKETIEKNFGALKEFESPFQLRKFISDLQQQNISLLKEIGAVKQELVETKEKLRKDSEELTISKSQKKQQHKKIIDQDKKIKSLKIENSSLISENSSLRNILNTYVSEGEIIHASTYDKLKSQHIETLEEKVKHLESNIQQLEQQNEEITKKNLASEKELSIQLNKLREKIDNCAITDFGPSPKLPPGVPPPRLYQIKINTEDTDTADNLEADKLPEDTTELILKLSNIEKSHSKLLNLTKKRFQLLKLLFGYEIQSCGDVNNSGSDERYLLSPTLPHPSQDNYFLFSLLRSESTLTLDQSPYLEKWKKEAEYYVKQKESVPAFLASTTLKSTQMEILKEN